MIARSLKSAVLLMSFVFCGLIVYGCGSDDSGTETTDTASSDAPLGLIMLGQRSEQGFYNDMYTGANEAAEKQGSELVVVDKAPTAAQQQLQAFDDIIAAGSKLIIVDGSLVTSAAKAAELNPDVEFGVYLSPVPTGIPNLHGYNPDQAAQGYVLGVVAAEISSTQHVGFVQGFADLPGSQSEGGFRLGATATDPNIGYSKAIVGSYSDAAKARDLASAQISDGADVLMGYVDTGLDGVIEAAGPSDAGVMTASGHRCERSTLMAADAPLPTVAAMQLIVDNWTAGELPDGTVAISYENSPEDLHIDLCQDYDRPDLEELVKKTEAQFASGEIELPKELQPDTAPPG